MYGVVLIVVLVVTGGAIAFIGDRLGTKIGKKKLSVFGLRPRHTSIVVTIITGILITTLTFIVLAAASENVRLALFGMEKLNAQMKQAQAEVEQAGADLLLANTARDRARMDLVEAQKDVDRLLLQRDDLSRRNGDLESANATLEGSNALLTAGNRDLQSANVVLAEKNTGLSTANARLGEENTVLEQRNKALGEGLQFVREGDIVYQAGEVIASGVISRTADAQSLNAEMASIVYLANRNVAQKTGVAAEEGGVWIYQKEYEQAMEKAASVESDMIVRIVAAGNLVRGEPVRANIELYPNRRIYQKNEFVLSERFVLAGKDGSEAERTILSFLKEVNNTAVKRGILPDPLKGSVGVIGGTQFYDVVNSMVSIRGDILISAYAAQDTDTQGPLRLRLKVEKLNRSE